MDEISKKMDQMNSLRMNDSDSSEYLRTVAGKSPSLASDPCIIAVTRLSEIKVTLKQ